MLASCYLDPGGHRWPPTYPPDSKQFFSSLAVFTVFRVLNFWGRFEALNEVFWQFGGQRVAMIYLWPSQKLLFLDRYFQRAIVHPKQS